MTLKPSGTTRTMFCIGNEKIKIKDLVLDHSEVKLELLDYKMGQKKVFNYLEAAQENDLILLDFDNFEQRTVFSLVAYLFQNK